MSPTVMDVMHRGVVTCNATATLDEVARIMVSNDVAALVVIDEQFDACGVVTKTDLLRHYGEDLSSTAVESIMAPKLITVSPDTPIEQAVEKMRSHRVHQLVIVTNAGVHRRPVGIFANGDVIALMAGEPRPESGTQTRCSECIRRILSVAPDLPPSD